MISYEKNGYEVVTDIKSHTPKHPQKKGIEKTEIKDGDAYSRLVLEITEKMNELIDEVNNLTRE